MQSSNSQFNRRSFLKRTSLAAPFILGGSAFASSGPKEMAADLVIIGGGLGGCAAALAAARNNLRVIMTEETDWIGGQLTQQAVPPDENHWIESFGATQSFLSLRQKIRDYYIRNYPLTEKAKRNPLLNPGNGWVSRLCHEPRVSLAVLDDLFAPYLASGKVQILLRHQAVSAAVHTDRVQAVRVRDLNSCHKRILHAPYFADATELGDLLPLTRTEFVTGAESQSETTEPHAPAKARPDEMQGFTMTFALEYLDGQDHVIDKPSDYNFWQKFMPKKEHQAAHRLLSFDDSSSKKIGFDPRERKGFWTYRRIVDRDNFQPGFYPGDISLINWPQNDYSSGSLIPVNHAAHHIARAKQQSLSLLYWLQTEAPRPDGGTGWKGLRLRPDIVGTGDGLAKYPYVRESRRIKAEFTVLEQHVSTDARMKETGLSHDEVRAAVFKDSVGIGSYRVDIHTTTTGGGDMYLSTLPFQIPLGALIPKRVENLIPACKNIGVTHITNGCYRLHPVEWNIGESAGSLVAFCLAQERMPREVRANEDLFADFQKQLTRDGVRLEWPKEVGPV